MACEERVSGRHPAFYVFKPLTTLLFLGAALSAGDIDPVYRQWICAGLVLSMCGDIALMFSGNLAFMAGLGSFLVAHLLFIWALLSGETAQPPWISAAPLLAGAVFLVWLLPRTAALKIPVMLYVLALGAMSVAAAARYAAREDLSGLLAALGAAIFLLSDAALAVCQFQGPYRRAQALILSTYFLAIGLIAASVQGSSDVEVAFHDAHGIAAEVQSQRAVTPFRPQD